MRVQSTSEEVEVTSGERAASTINGRSIDEQTIRRHPAARDTAVQSLIATAPGWSTEDNGLVHVRGVDDGVLFVQDGIPMVDRVDSISGTSFDPEMVRNFTVLNGNIPAEFGGRSGAVVNIQPRSGLDGPMHGVIRNAFGSYGEREVGTEFGAPLNDKLGVLVSQTTLRSDRFLDPVGERNFHNTGTSTRMNARVDWQPSARGMVLLDVIVGRKHFDVPNDAEQQAAGQAQRQHLGDESFSAAWQHAWSAQMVTNIALFERRYRSELAGSERDTPLFADAERRHSRRGAIGSVTRALGGHTLKAGVEVNSVTSREFLRLAVTDVALARERDIVEPALEFTLEAPFTFRGSATGLQYGVYVQDEFSPVHNLNILAGVRYDRTSLPRPDSAVSPRVGAAYLVAKTGTTLRGSFNSFYMPPQIENLLLANSEEARRLSPFEQETGGGRAIRPERSWQWEIGAARELGRRVRLDVAQWWRGATNVGDPNVFLNTTLIFPNSVAKGRARGVDVFDWVCRQGC